MRRWFAVCSLLCLPTIAAGAQGTASYRRYVQRITSQADSVAYENAKAVSLSLGIIQQQMKDVHNTDYPQQLALVSSIATIKMAKKLNDFDAMNPPPDLVRIHEQMVEPLRAIIDHTSQFGALNMYVSCKKEIDLRETCNSLQRSDEVGSKMMAELMAQHSAVADYSAARERATTVLKQHGVTLPATITDPAQ